MHCGTIISCQLLLKFWHCKALLVIYTQHLTIVSVQTFTSEVSHFTKVNNNSTSLKDVPDDISCRRAQNWLQPMSMMLYNSISSASHGLSREWLKKNIKLYYTLSTITCSDTLTHRTVTHTCTYRPSAHIRISDISAGVPMKLPTAPAVIPIAAFVIKFGGFPSLPSQNIKKHAFYVAHFLI